MAVCVGEYTDAIHADDTAMMSRGSSVVPLTSTHIPMITKRRQWSASAEMSVRFLFQRSTSTPAGTRLRMEVSAYAPPMMLASKAFRVTTNSARGNEKATVCTPSWVSTAEIHNRANPRCRNTDHEPSVEAPPSSSRPERPEERVVSGAMITLSNVLAREIAGERACGVPATPEIADVCGSS